MKATELIHQLSELVKIHGDRVVTIASGRIQGWHEDPSEPVVTIDATKVFTEVAGCGCPGDDVPTFELKT